MRFSSIIEPCLLAPGTWSAKRINLASTTRCRLEPKLPPSVGLASVSNNLRRLVTDQPSMLAQLPSIWSCAAISSTSPDVTSARRRSHSNHVSNFSKSCRSLGSKGVLRKESVEAEKNAVESGLVAHGKLAWTTIEGMRWGSGAVIDVTTLG